MSSLELTFSAPDINLFASYLVINNIFLFSVLSSETISYNISPVPSDITLEISNSPFSSVVPVPINASSIDLYTFKFAPSIPTSLLFSSTILTFITFSSAFL